MAVSTIKGPISKALCCINAWSQVCHPPLWQLVKLTVASTVVLEILTLRADVSLEYFGDSYMGVFHVAFLLFGC